MCFKRLLLLVNKDSQILYVYVLPSCTVLLWNWRPYKFSYSLMQMCHWYFFPLCFSWICHMFYKHVSPLCVYLFDYALNSFDMNNLICRFDTEIFVSWCTRSNHKMNHNQGIPPTKLVGVNLNESWYDWNCIFRFLGGVGLRLKAWLQGIKPYTPKNVYGALALTQENVVHYSLP